MAKVTVGLPQGTRDFGPEVVRKRNYILNTIRNIFELYGFQPLETPAMENLETLMGKYGEEGDKLIFKILNNGLSDPKNSGKAKAAFENILQGKNDKNLTERALRYDLTIPFARYVAMNHGQLSLPFKRYQIQPVWRADRPQKGRYREFYQCDADVVGSDSLLNEVELAIIYLTVFEKLGLTGCSLQVNNRKVLKGVMEICGVEKLEKKILVIIDKTDKIGATGVEEELLKENIAREKLEKLLTVYSFTGDTNEKIAFLQQFLAASPVGLAGTAELAFITAHPAIRKLTSGVRIDLSLARGLDYYTGTIFEVKPPPAVQMGSIGGGGRYNDLTGLFGVPGIPGVGISFGVDRIYDVMEELKLFPEDVYTGTQVLFFNLGKHESDQAFLQMQQLRDRGIRCELYHETAKMDRQFKYAEKKNIPAVVIIGSRELETMTCVVKNLQSGKQQTIPAGQLAAFAF
jgi:histidyl-tRNA synthetase